MDAIEQRCIWLAEYLQCNPQIVHSHYLKTGADTAIDSSQNDELKADLENLYIAENHAAKVLNALTKLSEISKTTQLLGGPKINEMAAELYRNLQFSYMGIFPVFNLVTT